MFGALVGRSAPAAFLVQFAIACALALTGAVFSSGSSPIERTLYFTVMPSSLLGSSGFTWTGRTGAGRLRVAPQGVGRGRGTLAVASAACESPTSLGEWSFMGGSSCWCE